MISKYRTKAHLFIMRNLALSVLHTPGPKGVIHDWRRFKLESEDHDSIPPNKRELLRQMSNPKSSNEDTREKVNRKVNMRHISTQKKHNDSEEVTRFLIH